MDIKSVIKDTNIKRTVAREELIEQLRAAKKPLCYEELRDSIYMDKATFYRNMSIFEKHNIVYSFMANDTKRYYELRSDRHAHFECVECGSVECVRVAQVVLDGYEVEDMILKGRCRECKK